MSSGTTSNTASEIKLWGGRFQQEADAQFQALNNSLPFDQKLLPYDITGSIAHAKMLGRQGIIPQSDADLLVSTLESLLADYQSSHLTIDGSTAEDVHTFVEQHLIAKIGDVGKKLHTGRSRNDQVALDLKLYLRDQVSQLDKLLHNLLTTLITLSEDHIDTLMPGYTHLQRAQPVTLAHHFLAYAEMFSRDRSRLKDLHTRMGQCPLGAGALAGAPYPLDRQGVAKDLGFDGPTWNSLDTVSDRDHALEALSAFSITMMHLSRFCEELVIWNSLEFGFVEMADAFATGSSMMPQKKNPDAAELIRGKAGRVYGSLISLLTTMKALPLAYNKDMQEDKEPLFDAVDTVGQCLTVFTGMLASATFKKEAMATAAANGFTNATDLADYLVEKNVPFRDAHEVVGKLVLYCLEKQTDLLSLSLEEFQQHSPVFEASVYEAIGLSTCLSRRQAIGGPAKERTLDHIRHLKQSL
ncbi:MAG: argininosuccinate lyase [Vampirovibrio sp.]|nr:argininosuccinate lyase [Vampirovibrio sp.]